MLTFEATDRMFKDALMVAAANNERKAIAAAILLASTDGEHGSSTPRELVAAFVAGELECKGVYLRERQ